MGIVEILGIAFKLIEQIVELAEQGVSEEEIKERVFAPGSVGEDLLKSVRSRRKQADEYLGRD